MHDGEAVVGFDTRSQSGQSLEMDIGEDAQLTRKALAPRLHMCGAGHGQAKAAFCTHCEPLVFLICGG